MSNPGKRFRIAFSFAGEKREFVRETAHILAEYFERKEILYDKFHESEFARRDLGFYLPDLYHRDADLVVVVACGAYQGKQWPNLEFTAIHDRLSQRDNAEVLLARFNLGTLPGVYSTAGFIELDGKTPEDFASLILERLASLGVSIPKRKRARQTRPRDTGMTLPSNNLPRLASFFGREKELKIIADALAPKTRTWGVLVDGPGGMGKTSLAIRAAELTPPGQFQRILFLSSKSRALTPDGERSLSQFVVPGYLEMLSEMARQLGRPELTKQPENERARLLIDALVPAHVLLILDNLESLHKDQQDQLYDFLSQLPPGSKAIITSRRRTDVDARIIRLDRLEQDAALGLLDDLARDRPLLVKASREELIHLYEETGGNPLLLRWIVGQLGRGHCRTLADALAFLRSAPPGNDPLEFIFGDLLETFTESETKILAALTYFTTPIETKYLAELSGLTLTAAQTALADLSNRALVVPDDEEHAFALVPMVAEFLRRRRPEAVVMIGSRLEKRAYALIVENGYKKHDRFPVLDAAWPTVTPAIPLLIAGPNARLQTVCDALNFFLEFTGRWDERLSLSQQAEAKALAAGDDKNAGWRAHQAGRVFQLREQAEPLLACADRAADHWERAQAGDRERAIVIRLRGWGHQLKRDYPAAIAAFRKALELHRTREAEGHDVATVLNDVAGAEQMSGDYAGAERDYREALRVGRALGDAEGVALYTGNLAALALAQDKWPDAEALAREALPLSEAVGRQELIAEDSRRLAQALVRQGKASEALPHARRAVDLYTSLGAPDLKYALETLRESEA